jgi:FkbM family methyltransferase
MYEELQIRNIACLALAKTAGPCYFLDVGAAAGPNHPALDYLLKQSAINFHGLEPDPIACEHLRRTFPTGTFTEHAIADVAGERTLYVTLVGGCSSCLEPNEEVISKYPIANWMKVIEKREIQVTTASHLILNNLIPIPDFIKLDIQGLEYEALQGFGDYLDNVIGIELEATLKPIYKNQKLLWQIIELLNDRGFILRDLQHQGPFEHELIEANVFFSRSPTDESVNIYKLKLWEFFSEISSPQSLGQLKIRNGAPGQEIFAGVSENHWQRLLGELV